MSIRVLKSSAGAGKTFNLAKTYIRLLLEGEDGFAYRHILAVTFTNKATAEMKNRILKELDVLVRTPEKSPYIKEFSRDFGGAEAVSRRAGLALMLILHDYGAFSVSTIDRFFQNALRSFAREMGRFPDYQIELDRDSLIRESVDRMLDSLGTDSDKELRSWILSGALERIEEKGSLSLEDNMVKMAKRVGNDNYRAVIEENGLNPEESYSREHLKDLKTECAGIKAEFEKRVAGSAKDILRLLESLGLTFENFNYKFLSPLEKYASGAIMQKPTDAFVSRCANPDKWLSDKRNNARNGSKIDVDQVTSVLFKPLEAFCNFFKGREYERYLTACIVRSQIYNLGLAGEFTRNLKELMAVKNIMSLDESNLTLRDIIAGSDAPFVYEKMGTRYEHFLLDEFQDTSLIQWENFKPLLKESSSSGNFNLLVGDVKQSIYRWRGGDWRLLASRVKADFPEADDSDPLKENWRSRRAIVEYNNAFFSYAARMMDDLYAREMGLPASSLAGNIYADAPQIPMSKDSQPGYVNISFCEPDDEMSVMLSSVQEANEAGAGYGQIAVLVRNNVAGAETAAFLSEHGIPVISDDSMHVKSSAAVHRLVSLLAFAANPADPIGKFLAEGLGVEAPERYDSLYDLAELLLRRMDEHEPIEGEVLYVQAFMDILLAWTSSNGNALPAFLEYWEGLDPEISSPGEANAVRILTIHKSKGLEFPYVIFPFAEQVGLFRMEHVWCCPSDGELSKSLLGRNAYDILVSGKLRETLFADNYRSEVQLQYIDNLNTFYVAMTRAVNVLHVIASSKEAGKINTMADILHSFELASSGIDHGKMYDFSKDASDGQAAVTVEPGFPSYPLNIAEEEGEDVRIRGRLKFRSDAVDFFSPEGQTGILASARLKGIVLHKILSTCKVAGDLPGAIDNACASGLLELGMREEYGSFLGKALEDASVKGWFAPGLRVLDEAAVIDTDGQLYRPDRVVIDPSGGSVTVIDYKFGSAKPSYRRQVANYCRLYRDMGYPDVSGWLWYVGDGVTERVV